MACLSMSQAVSIVIIELKSNTDIMDYIGKFLVIFKKQSCRALPLFAKRHTGLNMAGTYMSRARTHDRRNRRPPL